MYLKDRNNVQNGFMTKYLESIKIFCPILLLSLTRQNTKITQLDWIGFAHSTLKMGGN